MYYQIQIRRGTAAEWTAANSILAAGELAIESDTNKMKVGNGSTAWTSLAYSTVTPTQLNLKADLASPTFTGTVTLPSTTSIGTVSSTELGYVDGVTSAIQTQLDSKLTTTTAITSGRNRIINGDFKIWQRGAGAFTSSNTYTADRWAVVGASGQTISVTQQSFTPGNAISGFEPAFFARIAWSGTPSGTFWFTQRVEDVRTFAGQQVVLSFWAKASSSTSVFTPTIEQNFGTGGSSIVSTTTSSITLTTSWQRFSIPISIPSISGKTIGTNSYLDVRPLNGGSTVNGINIDIWGIQLEAGAVATPFEFEDVGETFAKCQRYFQKSYPLDTNPGTNGIQAGIVVGGGPSVPNLGLIANPRFPVAMRTGPVITIYSYTSSQVNKVSDAYSGTDYSGTITSVYVGPNAFMLYNTTGTTLTSSLGQMFHYTANAEM